MLDEDRRAAVSGEAKHLYREEPDLFMAASKEYSGKYSVILSIFITSLVIILGPL